MPDGEQKQMKTILFLSSSAEDHLKSIETLTEGLRADGRCEHKICFRPIMANVFQFICGVKDEKKGMQPIGCHEILYLPINKSMEIARLEVTKNVVLKKNSMCFVGKGKKKKLEKVIDWLLEETEDIKL